VFKDLEKKKKIKEDIRVDWNDFTLYYRLHKVTLNDLRMMNDAFTK